MFTVIHAVIGYIFLLLVVRVLARRPGAQMTAFEFVLIFLMGGVIILATAGDDRSITNCFGGVITIAFMHRTLATLKQRHPRLGALVDGTPLVLLKNNEWQMDAMRGARLNDTDVMAAARTKGIMQLEDIEYAVLERNGAISVFEKEKK
jgi:uncharacterized membrane protein YcaP (DUF421 family)